tara:strand:- start:6875 stop:7303 length:429 start_codon:yes stop_codon:yes gene_type:complete
MKQILQSKDSGNDVTKPGFKDVKNKNFKLKRNKERLIKKDEIGIPKEVANRMARRIAFTTGLPTIAGMGIFIGSYYLITNNILEIAPVITLVSSGTCFFLGLVGLSYGILSASWDQKKGSFLGIENIRPNIKRMREAFKSKS